MFEQLLVVLSGHQVKPLWRRRFGFVSGYDSSRATGVVMGLRPNQGDEKRLSPSTTFHAKSPFPLSSE
jgi:hypothetical protein